MTDPNRDEIEAWREQVTSLKVWQGEPLSLYHPVRPEQVEQAVALMRRAPAAPSQPHADVALAIAELDGLREETERMFKPPAMDWVLKEIGYRIAALRTRAPAAPRPAGTHLLRTLREWIVDEFDGADAGDIVAQIDRLLALPAAAEPASEWPDFWVIEREREPGTPMYWVGPSPRPFDPWMEWGDVRRAMRWHTKGDAEEYLSRIVTYDVRHLCKVTQHVWLDTRAALAAAKGAQK